MFKKEKEIYIIEEGMQNSVEKPDTRIYKSMKDAKADFAQSILNLLLGVSNVSMTNETHMINCNCQYDILSTDYCQCEQHVVVDNKFITLKSYTLRESIYDKSIKVEVDNKC